MQTPNEKMESWVNSAKGQEYFERKAAAKEIYERRQKAVDIIEGNTGVYASWLSLAVEELEKLAEYVRAK